MFSALQMPYWHAKKRDQKSETLTNNRMPDLPFLKWQKQHPNKFKTTKSLMVTLSTYIKFKQPNKKLDHWW